MIKKVGYELIDSEFELTNFYDCESTIYTSRAFIKYRIIKFAGFYFLVGKYSLLGVCREDEIHPPYYKRLSAFGNQVLKVKHISDQQSIDETGSIKKYCEKEMFKNDLMETYFWITVRCSDTIEEISFDKDFLLSKETINDLMCDILGEAG